MTTAPLEELRMLTRVAHLYHIEGLRQADVAERLSLSQSGVSRALRRAAQLGIVRTVVVPPPGVHADLEDRLRVRYALRDAVVVDAGRGDVTPALGAATAAYLSRTLARGERIGIASWSATLMAAADAMHERTAARAAAVTQLVGGLGSPGVQFRLTERLAELTGAEASLLPAPGMLESASVRRALVRDPAVAGVMDQWERLTLALVGIAPDTLRAVRRRIGVAGGPEKHPAVRGALRGGWINVLITDAASARRLAEETP
jgi:DNA-binding transcriptional regulator LsrR (DeoR family)